MKSKKGIIICTLCILAIAIGSLYVQYTYNNTVRHDGGPILYSYYNYNNKCYQLTNIVIRPAYIDKKINNQLYLVKNSDSNDLIALQYMGKYYKLKYAFEQIIEWQERPYTIEPNALAKAGKQLDYVGDYKIYSCLNNNNSDIIIDFQNYGQFVAHRNQ